MSRQLINEYRAELDRLRTVSGSRRESVLREAFKDLLKRWARSHDLQFVAEHNILTKQMTRIYIDGALLHGLRVPFGYWEAKDENDNLAAEIEAKFRKGYPKDNIVFTDDETAVLYQNGVGVIRAYMQDDDDSLLKLLTRFFAHERQEIADFNKAVKQFAADLPDILKALRNRIAEKQAASNDFADAIKAFLAHAQKAINPAVDEDDVKEMLIQHILTEDIFAKVFNDPEFHRKNNVAAELYKLEEKLFARGEKTTLLRALDPYYAGISSTAALIQSHSEKQGFLKALYEDFYKAYNRKAADRLGVVYTPSEMVRFMIRSADWLTQKHFGKALEDRGVEILDPATGTGTFIVELLEHFRGNHEKLRYKYKEELHANEVAILPYYVANLNIEATYQAITGQFAEFENLCLVDTLDNVDGLGIHAGHQFDLLGSLSDTNIERIKRQNRRRISVIIGNPPYNANQQNENENNKNRAYIHIDKRIKETYIKASAAQKTKLYDMYARFYRWASDRLGGEGVVAFVTNRSFIDSRTFDGFRKLAAHDFQDIWLIDLGGDVRSNPKLSGTKHNVFGIQTGVAIALLVKSNNKAATTIQYTRCAENDTAEDKLSWLNNAHLDSMAFSKLKSTAKGDWLSRADDSEWKSLLPIASRANKESRAINPANSIFKTFSFGLVTNRDDWLYDANADVLKAKVATLSTIYNAELDRLIHLPKADRAAAFGDDTMKWTRSAKRALIDGRRASPDNGALIEAMYRPFDRRFLKFDRQWVEMPNLMESFFGKDAAGKVKSIVFSDPTSQKPFMTLAVDRCADMHLVGAAAGGVVVPFTRCAGGIANITDWAVKKFVAHYGKKGVSRDAIFHYVYAVLHDPVYREVYAPNLKRDFPRIPFYPEFNRWAAWGARLMSMHIGYEDCALWPVERIDTPSKKRAGGTLPKPILKSMPEQGLVRIDEDTQLTGIPASAWSYRLGNRSAIDWVLDQKKEKLPRDQTIRDKFNSYRFDKQKEHTIALLAKVVRVSVDSVAIVEAMRRLPSGARGEPQAVDDFAERLGVLRGSVTSDFDLDL